MSGKNSGAATVILLAGCLTGFGTSAIGQTTQSGQQPSTTKKDQKSADSGSTLDVPSSQPPVTAEEDAAVKAYQAIPSADLPKKIAAGEDFLKKYPESRNVSVVYSSLVFAYIQNGNPEKAFEIGDKEVAIKPDDVQTMAILSQTLPRAMTSTTPEPEKRLAKAETYGKRAIEITPTLNKPEGMADQNFLVAKNETLTMAHSGLGLVYFRRGKYSDAIPELEQSVKIDPSPTPDPVNLYILGMANQKESHFEEAAAVFAKCAAIPGGLQTPCKNAADEAKKQGSTQLSAPK